MSKIKNLGAAQNRNKGVNLATGEYIGFLDADDYWEEGKVQKQLKLLEETRTVVGSIAREILNTDGKCTGKVMVE